MKKDEGEVNSMELFILVTTGHCPLSSSKSNCDLSVIKDDCLSYGASYLLGNNISHFYYNPPRTDRTRKGPIMAKALLMA